MWRGSGEGARRGGGVEGRPAPLGRFALLRRGLLAPDVDAGCIEKAIPACIRRQAARRIVAPAAPCPRYPPRRERGHRREEDDRSGGRKLGRIHGLNPLSGRPAWNPVAVTLHRSVTP